MKKLIYIPLVILYLVQWLFTVASNVTEVIADGFEEIIITLENFIAKNGKTKPDGPDDKAGAPAD